MDTVQLLKILKSDPVVQECFNGVYARDMLPHIAKEGCYVCNTDKSDKPGSHWVAMYIEDNRCEYFDSYGFPPLFSEFSDFLSHNVQRWTYNDVQIQSTDSDVCGHYCVLYLMYRCRGMCMKDFVSLFSSNHKTNDDIVRNSICVPNTNVLLDKSECACVQTCSKI